MHDVWEVKPVDEFVIVERGAAEAIVCLKLLNDFSTECTTVEDDSSWEYVDDEVGAKPEKKDQIKLTLCTKTRKSFFLT